MANIPVPRMVGSTVLFEVAIPATVYATLQGIASADTGVSLDWLCTFALKDFARQYADHSELQDRTARTAQAHTLAEALRSLVAPAGREGGAL